MRAAEEKLTWKQLLHYKSEFEVARNDFDTEKVKMLLQEVVSGYKADKDIVDPVWNKSVFLSANDDSKINTSDEDGNPNITH